MINRKRPSFLAEMVFIRDFKLWKKTRSFLQCCFLLSVAVFSATWTRQFAENSRGFVSLSLSLSLSLKLVRHLLEILADSCRPSAPQQVVFNQSVLRWRACSCLLFFHFKRAKSLGVALGGQFISNCGREMGPSETRVTSFDTFSSRESQNASCRAQIPSFLSIPWGNLSRQNESNLNFGSKEAFR